MEAAPATHLSPEALVADAADVVSLPEAYLKIRELLEDPDTGIADFAAVVNTDPGLTARVLKYANSAFFGFAARIDSPRRAIGIIGTSHLHDLVLSTAAVHAFKDIPGHLVNMSEFWRRSVLCGVYARLLATARSLADCDRLFVTGLLHEIGHLAMYVRLPDAMTAAVAAAARDERPLYAVERDLLGTDYAEVGGALLRTWNLPAVLRTPVRWHLQPTATRDFQLEALIVHLSNYLVMEEQLGADNGQVPEVVAAARERLCIDDDALAALKERGQAHLGEALQLVVNAGAEQSARKSA